MQSLQAHKVQNRDYLISPKQLQGNSWKHSMILSLVKHKVAEILDAVC